MSNLGGRMEEGLFEVTKSEVQETFLSSPEKVKFGGEG